LGQAWSNQVKPPLGPSDIHGDSSTFAAFSKFHQNTSNSPNVKVVQFVEGHNFHVEWHLRFEVEKGEKPWSMQFITIHQRHGIGMPFVHNLLIKTPIGLFKSCRGSIDLQLCYSHLGALMLQNLELNPVKQC
jgi:hypothetical protein